MCVLRFVHRLRACTSSSVCAFSLQGTSVIHQVQTNYLFIQFGKKIKIINNNGKTVEKKCCLCNITRCKSVRYSECFKELFLRSKEML